MSEGEIWNERIGVTGTIRENILLYLSQEGEVNEDELRNTLCISREIVGLHFRFLEEHGFLEREYVDMGSTSAYQLSEKGDELVADIRRGDKS